MFLRTKEMKVPSSNKLKYNGKAVRVWLSNIAQFSDMSRLILGKFPHPSYLPHNSLLPYLATYPPHPHKLNP